MATLQAPKTRRPAKAPASKSKANNKPVEPAKPLALHRKWQVTTVKAGKGLEPQLQKAGFQLNLLAVQAILDRCRAGVTLEVQAYEVTVPEIPAAEAKEFLATKDLVPCCACMFTAWALAYGRDVGSSSDEKETWLTEMVAPGPNGRKTAIMMSGADIYALGTPEVFRKGMMILVVSKADAEKHSQNG
jgi:hypothetical protein